MDETEVPPREPGRSPGLQGQLLRPRALAAELFRPSRVNSQRLPRGFHSGGSTPGEDIGSERRTRRKPQEWCFNVILTTTTKSVWVERRFYLSNMVCLGILMKKYSF